MIDQSFKFRKEVHKEAVKSFRKEILELNKTVPPNWEIRIVPIKHCASHVIVQARGDAFNFPTYRNLQEIFHFGSE